MEIKLKEKTVSMCRELKVVMELSITIMKVLIRLNKNIFDHVSKKGFLTYVSIRQQFLNDHCDKQAFTDTYMSFVSTKPGLESYANVKYNLLYSCDCCKKACSPTFDCLLVPVSLYGNRY